MKIPAMFVSHGAPTFAVEPGRAGPLLHAIGERVRALPGLRAILVVSPHWRTRGLRIGASAQPATFTTSVVSPRRCMRCSTRLQAHPGWHRKWPNC